MAKPTLVSGIQPTGKLHIGNYLGALKNFVDLQNSGKYECYFFIADLHSLTEPFDPKEKQKQILETTAEYLAGGLDLKKSVIFLQSAVSAHSEFAWILETMTPIGELGNMTQFKEKGGTTTIQTREEYKEGRVESEARAKLTSTNTGLLTYPILMTADILLYDAAYVPTGDDQDQHLELARMLARKFNKKFGKTFTEPRSLHTTAPRVMSVTNPEKKMSKSEPNGCIFLDDSPGEIESKIKRAVTDSGSEIKYDPKAKPAISNLLSMYAALGGESIKALEKKFEGETYSEFKSALADVVANHFADFRKKKKALLARPQALVATLNVGSKQAALRANKKIEEVEKKIGIAL